MCELARSFTSTDPLVVTPVVENAARAAAGRGLGRQRRSPRPRSIASAGEDDVVTREYRRGDDLRRIHWRSTARSGELMVRREEQPWQSRALLAAGHARCRRTAATGRPPRSRSRCRRPRRSACTWAGTGFTLDLVTDTGDAGWSPP